MKVNDIVKEIPTTEEQCMTYCEEGGKPKYKVTRIISNGTFKLYKCVAAGYKFLKSRANDPFFKEVT